MAPLISAAIGKAIKAVNAHFITAFNRGDFAAVADLYTEDGQIMPAGFDTFTGREAIQAFLRSAREMGVKSAQLETVELNDLGQTAIEVGKYALFAEGGQMVDTGKYLVIWEQEFGDWKLYRDIWTTSLPANA